MTYTKNVPQGNQQIASTQVPILNNFSYIDTAMKINHTWNGNAIGSEAPGSHQKIAFPNQGSDIASLPTGIADVLYSIAGNLYTYNGTKNPVSGYSGSGTVMITTTATAFITLPVTSGSSPIDTIGFVLVQGNPAAPVQQSVPIMAFFSKAGVLYPMQTVSIVSSGQIILNLSASNNQLYINRTSGSFIDYTAIFKYIYWPI